MLAVSVLTCWSGGAFGQEKWQESWEERCSSENEPDDCWAGKASRAETPKELRGIWCQDQKNRDRDVKSKKNGLGVWYLSLEKNGRNGNRLRAA
jgi:hypothetical protein